MNAGYYWQPFPKNGLPAIPNEEHTESVTNKNTGNTMFSTAECKSIMD